MDITCYRVSESACRIVPGRSDRQWMDETDQRFAYRCLPLSIANAMGWELLLPARVTARWNGGNGLDDLTVETDGPQRMASSHFGHGVLTFSVGYLFRTDPGIGLWARGVPNLPKDGIAPLEGIIETDWLDFTFTMNWKFTRPGVVTFEKDEPFCFITPVEYRGLIGVVPKIVPVADEAELKSRFEAWRDARLDFNARLAAEEPEAVSQGWQKWYMRGQNSEAGAPASGHISKLRLATPVEAPGEGTGEECSAK